MLTRYPSQQHYAPTRPTSAGTVITCCTACGMQIRRGTGVTAIHTMQLLERAYGLDRPGHSGGRQK